VRQNEVEAQLNEEFFRQAEQTLARTVPVTETAMAHNADTGLRPSRAERNERGGTLRAATALATHPFTNVLANGVVDSTLANVRGVGNRLASFMQPTIEYPDEELPVVRYATAGERALPQILEELGPDRPGPFERLIGALRKINGMKRFIAPDLITTKNTTPVQPSMRLTPSIGGGGGGGGGSWSSGGGGGGGGGGEREESSSWLILGAVALVLLNQ
tara:strand:+ start:220 stop:870 length:651 start_codon:yes stop_codon:yes gene_type:complete